VDAAVAWFTLLEGGYVTILGISASGRTDGVTAHAVRRVLESSGEPFEYLSLAGLQISGC